MKFSRGWLAGKCKVRYYSRSGCFFGTPNWFIFLRFYYQGKWGCVWRICDPHERGLKKYVKTPTKQFEEKRFRNEEWWESKHLLDATWRTRMILDSKDKKYNLSKIASYCKHLISDKHNIIYNVITKYELIFNVTIGTWKTKPVDIELHPWEKPYNSKPYPVPRARKAVFKR